MLPCCYYCYYSGSQPDCDPKRLLVLVYTNLKREWNECNIDKAWLHYREASSSSSELSDVVESPSCTDLLGLRRLLSWPDDVCGLSIEIEGSHFHFSLFKEYLVYIYLPKIRILWRTNVHLGPSLQHLAPLNLVTRNAVRVEYHTNPQSPCEKKKMKMRYRAFIAYLF